MAQSSIPLKYSISQKILNNLTQIAAAKEIIDNAFILPQWEIKLREEALLLSTHHSTHIEGNSLTLEQISRLAKGRFVMASRKDKQEVLNYLRVLHQLEKYSKQKLNVKLLLRIHKELTQQTLKKESDSGSLRKVQVVVGRHFEGKLIVSFKPPPTQDVPRLIKNYFNWLNNDTHNLNPILLAGISHYELVRIHPFIDGNGRTARTFATLLLYRFNFDIKRFFTLDDYYDSERSAYYKALQSVHSQKLDITEWLEYFTRGVNSSVTRVKEKVLELSRDKKAASLQGQVYLSSTQMKILIALEKKEAMRNSDFVKILKISRQAIHKDLAKLIQLELIETVGLGPQLMYKKK